MGQQCTYDRLGEQFTQQEYYECLTCWGPDSVYGACLYCGINCHKGHLIIKKSSPCFVCDCGRYKHKNQLCTRNSTSKSYVKQSMFLCHDCFDNVENNREISGVCYPCAQKCHNGHNLQYRGVRERFFCDCGLHYCKLKKCLAT